MPDSYTITPDGILLIANGVNPVLRWDGLSASVENAGTRPPTTQPALAGSGSGTITGTYYAYVRFVDRDGNVSNVSPLSAAATVADKQTITYTAVEVPTDAKVTRRQILRNTAGQTAVFYVDVDTTTLTGTTFTSTRTDAALSAQTPAPLFLDDGRPLINSNFVPPDTKAYLAQHQDRIFLGGEVEYRAGSVLVTNGSPTVVGQGTLWPSTFAGRFLYVDGGQKTYEIQSVNATTQTITLTANYAETTNPFATYSVKPARAESRLVWFSGAGLPESWSPADVVFIPEDGDRITGLFSLSSWLYICEERHLYRCTFQDDPVDDGAVFLAANRGLVNHRCVVEVEGTAYMLDEAGVHSYSPEGSQPISQPVQGLFERGPGLQRAPGRDVLKIRWEFKDSFHASFDPGPGVIRWFVCLTGSRLPRHALCYQIRRQAWWLEEYPWPIGASCRAVLEKQAVVLAGGPAGKVAALVDDPLDGTSPAVGSVRGTVTGASPLTLADSAAAFATSLAGRAVYLLDGAGKGQSRRIASATATSLTLVRPWAVEPAVGDTYQVGGIQWRYGTGWFRWADGDQESPRCLELLFEPTPTPGSLDARLYRDRFTSPRNWGTTQDSTVASGFTSRQDRPDLVCDTTRATGYAQKRFDRQKDLYLDGYRYFCVELQGVTGQSPLFLYAVLIGGAN